MRLKNPGRGIAVIKTPADLQKVRQHLLDLPVIEVISDELRALVEANWPDLVQPPRPNSSRRRPDETRH